MKTQPIPADSIPEQPNKTIYPPLFAALVQGRIKHKLGDQFGLTQFGVNLTELLPGAVSALLHRHKTQDEFICILQGQVTLMLNDQEYLLHVGDCMGFKAGNGIAHQLINRSNAPVLYLEIGDRSKDDEVEYPNDDLKATMQANGIWLLTHKDGTAYST